MNWGSVALRAVMPQIADSDALLLAVGIIGATVIPHAIYLHSGLTQARIPPRNDAERKQLIKASNGEVIVTLSLAGLVNIAMVLMAAAAFHQGHSDVGEIETAYRSLTPLPGSAAAALFLVSLLASGISSSAAGTLAGQVIMQGFVGFTIPIWLRRAVTMLPAFLVVTFGMNATSALVSSQVVLSIALPLPMTALVIFTGRPAIMGQFASTAASRAFAALATVLVISLNVFLVVQPGWSA
jgi:manganese transport protein